MILLQKFKGNEVVFKKQETVKKSGLQFIYRSKKFRSMFTWENILSRQTRDTHIFILKKSNEIESGSQETGNSE